MKIYEIRSILRKRETIIMFKGKGNNDRLLDFFILNQGDGRFLQYTRLRGIAQCDMKENDLERCDFLHSFLPCPIFSQRFVEKMSSILKDVVTFYPIDIYCGDKSKMFFIAKINNYIDLINHEKSEALKLENRNDLFMIPIVANENLGNFLIARDTKEVVFWGISEELKVIIIREKFKMKICEMQQ